MEYENKHQHSSQPATSLKNYKAPVFTLYGEASKLTQATDPALELISESCGSHSSDNHRHRHKR